MNKRIVLASAVALALSASSCRKFLDVNNNPNITQTVTVETLLPAADLYVGSSVGVDLQVIGSIWSQYWTQTPIASQYIAFEQYAPGQDAFSTAWSNLYSAAENYHQLVKLADSLHKKQYKAVGLLMQAYTFQCIADGWGDVPFTQALRGSYEDGHFTNPKYDSQVVVYRGILEYIDSAATIIDSAQGTAPGSDDLIYSGDMDKWRHFANTLKLKVLLRMSEIDPVGAQALIDTLYSTKPTFLGTGEDAKIAYGFSSSNKNPLYAEESSTVLAGIQNLGGSKTIIDSMNAQGTNGDPRAYIFFEGLSSGAVVGILQSDYNTSLPAGSYSIPNVYVAGDAQNANSSKAPVNFLTAAESYLLQAEVVARGWQTSSSGMTDDQLFAEGIKANFTYYSAALDAEWGTTAYTDYVTGGGYWTIYPTTGTTTDKIRHIITQKWFCMCGNQGFEAWTEWRRTGYPDFLVHPKNSLMGNSRPVRFLYPTNESTANANFPGLSPLTTRVWWDVL